MYIIIAVLPFHGPLSHPLLCITCRGRNALLDSLLPTREPMPIVLPQQLLSALPRNNTTILSHILILAKVPTRFQLPQNSKYAVPSEGSGKSENALAVAIGVGQSDDVQFGIIAHVDEVLRWHDGEEVFFPLVSRLQPVARAVARGAYAVAEVGVGEHGGDLEGWVGFFDRFPERALGFGFAGGVDLVARRSAGADLFQHGVVPGVLRDGDFFVRNRRKGCGAGGRHDQGFDLGFERGSFEYVEGSLDAGRDDFVGIVGKGQDGGKMHNSGDAFDCVVVGVLVDHVRDVDDLEQVLVAMFLLDVVDEELGFAGVTGRASDLVAGRDQLVDDVVADVSSCTGHEDRVSFLNNCHLGASGCAIGYIGWSVNPLV